MNKIEDLIGADAYYKIHWSTTPLGCKILAIDAQTITIKVYQFTRIHQVRTVPHTEVEFMPLHPIPIGIFVHGLT